MKKETAKLKIRTSFEQSEMIQQYMVGAIDSSEYDTPQPVETDEDKVQWLMNIFIKEYYNSRADWERREKTKVQLFADWLPGLPSSFNVDFENHRMLEMAAEWGIDINTEDKEEELIENWYSLITDEFFSLVDLCAPRSAGAQAVLKNCTVEGHLVKLPAGKIDRALYLEVKNSLELIGGAWKGGKTQGFVFNEDPTALLSQISQGHKRNLKKEFQFFGTPDSLADKLVYYADIKNHDTILEPSAGHGAIVKAISRDNPNVMVSWCELMPLNRSIVDKLPGQSFLCEDFLQLEHSSFSKIIANPPFNKNQDIDHIRAMYHLLGRGGRMVTLCSKHYQQSSNKKETDFRQWLDDIGAEVEEIEAGAFKESGTTIATVLIIINK